MLSYIGGSAAKQKRDECGSSLFFYFIQLPANGTIKYVKKHKTGLSDLDAESVFFAPKLYFLYRGRKKLLKE